MTRESASNLQRTNSGKATAETEDTDSDDNVLSTLQKTNEMYKNEDNEYYTDPEVERQRFETRCRDFEYALQEREMLFE